MPYKPKIVTRTLTTTTVTEDLIPKNSGLSNSELDSNFLNMRDGSFGVKGADSTVFDIKAGDTVNFTGATISSDSTGVFIDTGGGNETITALTSGTSIDVDCALGNVFTVTLAHNATFTFTNFDVGQAIAIKIKQDATGSRTGTFTGVKFTRGYSTLSTAANKIDFISIFNDGTDKLGAINLNYT